MSRERQLLLVLLIAGVLYVPLRGVKLAWWPVAEAQAVVLTVPRVCVEALTTYIHQDFAWEDAKMKLATLQSGAIVQVGDCAVRVEP